MTITMLAPKGLTDFRLEGRKIEIRDGLVAIEPHDLDAFLAHGFTRRSAPSAAPAPPRETRASKEQTP
ncbi:MAG TPA: hypothetical protein VK446_10470 [Methylocystis sp.]|nr:hypothetical protein [Methylocystis sp.]